MKYVAPYGMADPDAPYVNGDPTIGRQGSIPPAAAFEHPMRELVAVIDKSEFTPSETDLLQVAKGMRSQRMNWAQDTGSVNNLSVAFDPPLAAYTVGLPIRVRVNATNTGAATIDAGAGRVAIKLMSGANTTAGDLPAGGVAEMAYDGTSFQLVNFFGLAGGAGPVTEYSINIPYAVDSDANGNIIVATFTPAPEILTAGDVFLVKINGTNSGPAVLRINSTSGWQPDKQIKPNGGGPLLQGDLANGDVVLFTYDGTQCLVTPNPNISESCTLSVPTQFADVPAALLVLKRKTISPTATVAIQVAAGVIAPFQVNHPNADRIVIRGTMLAAAPIWTSFAQSGPSPTARAQDSQNNIVMLRSRYGTEVRITPGVSFDHCVQNMGPGQPAIYDMLLTGPNYSGFGPGYGIGRFMGLRVDTPHAITGNNVAMWGLDHGVYSGGGDVQLTNCWACGCFGNGFMLTGGGNLGIGGGGAFGNAASGAQVNQNAFGTSANAYFTCNQISGAAAGDSSEYTFNTCQATSNGYPSSLDLWAGNLSMVLVLGSSVFATTSPAVNVMGAYGQLVAVAG